MRADGVPYTMGTYQSHTLDPTPGVSYNSNSYSIIIIV